MVPLVIYERDGYIGRIKLNRPDKRNALSREMWAAIGEAVAQAAADPEARVILLSGEGPSFCAGLDLNPMGEMAQSVMKAPSAAQKDEFYAIVRWAQDIHTALEELPVPTIALIQAHCLGAGLELAVCCDLRLCTRDAQFALPEATLGLVTDVGGLQRLPRIVGPTKAREIAYRGHRFGGDEAAAMGLCNAVVDDQAALEKLGLEWAAEIASKPPLAMRGTKATFLFEARQGLREALEYNAARSAMVIPSEDLKEAITAYLQKRPGTYTGK